MPVGVVQEGSLWTGVGQLSSPRPWGCFRVDVFVFADRRVFPTPVGVFLVLRRPKLSRDSLPHARGGVSQDAALVSAAAAVFPTPVGVFLADQPPPGLRHGLPHARGGVSKIDAALARKAASSPRPWGCFSMRRQWQEGERVFPTPVGVFLRLISHLQFLKGLPHARGGVSQARLMYLSTMQQSYRQYADRTGLGAEQRELGWKKILSAAYSQLADKYITAGDLNAARKLVADDPLWMEGDQDKIRAKIQARAEALQAEAERRRKQAEEAAEKRAVQGTVDAVLSGAAGFPTLEEQREAAFRMVDQIEQPEIKDKLRTEISKEFAWREKARDATTAREVRQYQELARAQNWTPRQAADILSRATDISGTAREKLEKDYNGRAERATPENKAALAELRAMLDKGAERGGIDPKDTDAIDAYIYSHGLTYEQGVNAHRYAEQGGIAGEVTQTQINRAYKTLFPNRKEKSAPGDLLDLVGEELKRTAAGKSATDAEVRRVMSRLFAEGETEDAGWFAWGIGKDETYMDALRKGRGDAWSADVEVPAEDAARIEELLREEGVTPTPGRVRRYYWEEQEGKA